MKKIIALFIILPAVMLAACAPQAKQNPSMSSPTKDTHAPIYVDGLPERKLHGGMLCSFYCLLSD